ncbi:hypothetical protein [Campylobacter concisus]|uniref:hypothetical protein n=1 Tax=Campylobacter concisus TaxID=199 RepID=UPI001CA4A93D|nr:hypothetical protein [Campylobacter concisus]
MNYEVALFPLNNPLTPTTLEGHAMVLAHCMRFILKRLAQILKFAKGSEIYF